MGEPKNKKNSFSIKFKIKSVLALWVLFFILHTSNSHVEKIHNHCNGDINQNISDKIAQTYLKNRSLISMQRPIKRHKAKLPKKSAPTPIFYLNVSNLEFVTKTIHDKKTFVN